MRILAAHVDPHNGATYAVIVNPVAVGKGGLPIVRYRLIRASSPTWEREVNTTRSVSRTPGILIYETFDCPSAWTEHPSFKKRVDRFLREAAQLAAPLTRSPQ